MDGGQFSCIIQSLVNRLRMHDSDLRPSMNVHNLHWKPSNLKKLKGYNGVTSFGSGYGNVRWIDSCQVERLKLSYFKKWCICQDRSISSHSLRSWIRMSKSNRWITTVSTSTIAMASWLPRHLRLMGYSFWIAFCIKLRNEANTPPSKITAACWHLRRLGMDLGTMLRSGRYGTASWHTSVWGTGRSRRSSLPALQIWPGSVIARAASSAN